MANHDGCPNYVEWEAVCQQCPGRQIVRYPTFEHLECMAGQTEHVQNRLRHILSLPMVQPLTENVD